MLKILNCCFLGAHTPLLLPIGIYHLSVIAFFPVDSTSTLESLLERHWIKTLPKIQFCVPVLLSFEIPSMALKLFDSVLHQ